MSREWQPGDVAIRESAFSGEARMLSLFVGGKLRCPDAHPARAPHWHHVNGGWDEASGLSAYRPVVVVDPEDRKQVERLRDIYDAEVIRQNGDPDPRDVTPGARGNALQAALREFANPSPPKPDEPTGLGAVVEDSNGKFWVRSADDDCRNPWEQVNNFDSVEWTELDVVRVLSEGVTP